MTARRIPDGEPGRAAAALALEAGEVVAIPTDTVYGLAVSLTAADGIDRLFAAKGRPRDRAIGVIVADLAQAAAIAHLNPAADALAAAFWPGGLTLVLDARHEAGLPETLSGGRPTIGVRVADHPAPRALAARCGPLPTTSANRTGEPEARDAAEIEERLGAAVAVILDGGPAHGGPASTVVDATGPVPRILRAGAVPAERIEAVLAAAGLSGPIPGPDMGR